MLLKRFDCDQHFEQSNGLNYEAKILSVGRPDSPVLKTRCSEARRERGAEELDGDGRSSGSRSERIVKELESKNETGCVNRVCLTVLSEK